MGLDKNTADNFVEPHTDRAADSIVRQLEHRISSGELAPGLPLPAERDLMREYDVSRTVVREAISTLAYRGLIENRPRFRPIVRRPDYEAVFESMGGVANLLLGKDTGVKNLYESRIFVERMLVRDAAVSARKNDIAQLTEALEQNKAAIDNAEKFYETDIDFHAVLYEIPRNPIFPALHRAYKSWLHPQWITMPRSAERNYVNYLSHELIYKAIVDRDPDAAEAALSAHLNAAWEYVRASFEREG